jgi:hypothetical protein
MNAPTNAERTSPSRRIGLLLAALIAALLAALALVMMATQNAAQAHEETKTVDVPASQGLPGTAAGVYIHEGDRVVIEATGVVDLEDPGLYDNVPPNGIAGSAPAGPGFVLPSANVGALLGSIGQFSATNGGFVVGSEEVIASAPKSGELYLIVNDIYFPNNSGHFTAKVTVSVPDTRAPKVISTVPAAGAKGVAPLANIKANFSEDMRASTINGTTVKLFKQGSTTKVGAVVSYNASMDRAILNPTNSLKRGVTYKAVVTTFAKDKAGNRLDQKPGVAGLQQKVWYFKTAS